MAPQNLAELYAVITHPRRVKRPRAPEDALAVVEILLSMRGIQLLRVSPSIVERWVDLVRQRPLIGADLFDLQLNATMLAVGVRRIYTFNADDFTPFAELEVLTPPAA